MLEPIEKEKAKIWNERFEKKMKDMGWKNKKAEKNGWQERGKSDNIDKLSQGAELPRMETKKDEKK